ncbi:MAG: hypothetical protein ACE5HR_03025 [bacterium]
MKITYRALFFVTCLIFLTGLFLIQMDYAIAKKEGEKPHKTKGTLGHPPGWDKGKRAEGEGKGTKEKIKKELEDILGGGKKPHKTPGPSKQPPGWDEGKKVGWGGEGMPPGLAGKTEGKRGKSVKEHIKEKIKEKIDETLGGEGKGKVSKGKQGKGEED